MSKLLRKATLLSILLFATTQSFAAVTIHGYFYNTDPNTVHFTTNYPDSVQSSPIVPFNELEPVTINTKKLAPHTTLLTVYDDKGNSCDIGVTSDHMNTRYEIIHSTSDQFCVIAPAPNYVINIMPQQVKK